MAERRLPAATRVPPHSLDAEVSVLGGLMLDNRRFDDIADLLLESDFYAEAHRLIFRGIHKLAAARSKFDWVTVSEWLRDDVERDHKVNPQGLTSLERAGGQGFVAQITMDVPGASNVRAYAEIVRNRSEQRGLIEAGLDIVGLAQNPEGRGPSELIDEAEQKVLAIRARSVAKSPMVRSGDSIIALADSIPERIHGATFRRISTGLADLDRKIRGGLLPGQLIIIAGRPGMGKTTLAMNIADNIALRGLPTAVFSMEMGVEELQERQLSSIGGIRSECLDSGHLTDDEAARLVDATRRIVEMPSFIDGTGGLSPMELRAKARRLHAKQPLSAIVVDYIQLMQIPGAESRTNEISEISRSLKALAKELQVPVIALSQLNRGVESRDNKRPRMSDLRESGGIEQDADLILFVYRDEEYNKDSPDRGTAEIIIGKQRGAPTGVVRLASVLECNRFCALAPGWEPAAAPEQEPLPRARGYRAQPSRNDWSGQ